MAVELITSQRDEAAGGLSTVDLGHRVRAVLGELEVSGNAHAGAWLVEALSHLTALALAQWQLRQPDDDPDEWLRRFALHNAQTMPAGPAPVKIQGTP